MKTLIDWFFEWPERVSRHIAWLAPLFARFIVGWEFLWSGWGKLQNLPAIVENFVGWHIPAAQILAPFVSGVEFFGGIFLLVGFLTRISAGALGVTMIVAIASAKWDQVDSILTLVGFDESEYLALFLWLAIAGAGSVSVDRWMKRFTLAARKPQSALPFALVISLFAVGTIAALASSGATAATAVVIPVEQQRLILKDSETAVLGVVNPEVTVVEYFDYNCPYCRKLAPSIHALVNNDHKVAVVFKEWPIFGGISVYAARSALASQWQGKYLTAHDALIGAPRLSQAAEVDETLQNAGINLLELKRTLVTHGAQIDAILARNNAEARSLGMRGTPGLLVGRDVSTGIGDLAALQIAVAEARRTP